MAHSKVPKFGAWEGGENYTVYFENARQKKNNGQMINPNDPQEYPAMDDEIDSQTQTQTPPTQSTDESQGQQSEVPHFGAWDNGNNVGYTVYFENARKTKTTRPSKSEDGKAQAQAQAQAHMAKPDPQDARSKVPQFGDWNEGDGGAQYTAYFENARKNKNDGPGDVADRARPKARSEEQVAHGGVGSRLSEQRGPKEEGSETPLRQGRQTPGGQTPQHPKGGNKPQLKPTSRGSQNSEKGAAIPQFGVWNTDPSQAEGFTGAFQRSREDRMTPLNKNTPQNFLVAFSKTHAKFSTLYCVAPTLGFHVAVTIKTVSCSCTEMVKFHFNRFKYASFLLPSDLWIFDGERDENWK